MTIIPTASRHVPKVSESFPAGDQGGERAERIGPTPERLRHAEAAGADAVEHIVSDGVSRPRMLDGDVLSLLLSRGIIDNEEHDCGQEFYRHWYAGGLTPSGVVDLQRERVDGGPVDPLSEVVLWHRAKYHKMVRDLGQVHSMVLCDCVLMGLPLVEYGRRHCHTHNARLARERAQTLLCAALRQLVINVMGDKSRHRGVIVSAMAERVRPAIAPAMTDGEKIAS